MKHITQTVLDKYYRYQPGEFMPVYIYGQLSNRREFHLYKIRNWKQTYYQLTHIAG